MGLVDDETNGKTVMVLDESRLRDLLLIYRDGLLKDTLPFWLRHSLDPVHGGYTICLRADGSIMDTDKGVWQQARFAWLLSKLYNTVEARQEWLTAARLGVEFLVEHCFDPADGRMWFHVTRDGRPIRKRRYAYTESFASIAFAQFAAATQSDQFQSKAIDAFHRFVGHHQTLEREFPKFEPTRKLQSIGFPMITIATAQELREAIGFSEARYWIDQSIDVIRNCFMDDDEKAVLETVGPHGEKSDHFDGRTLNPGHAIEGAWFIMWEGKLREDPELIRLGARMLRWMWKRGWDKECGGVLYFVDLYGDDVAEYWHDMKFWWPHNETIIATLMAYVLTGETEFLEWHSQVHEWSYRHFPDHVHGEWFGYLRREGKISSRLKGNIWKGPFHLPRMQLMCWKILKEALSSPGIQPIG